MLKWFKKKNDRDPAPEGRSGSESAPASTASPSASAEPSRDAPLEQSGGAGEAEGEANRGTNKNLFSRLLSGVSKTQEAIAGRIRTAIGLKEKVDEDLLEKIEEILLQGDVGVRSTTKIVDRLRTEGRRRETYDAEALLGLVKESVCEILSAEHRTLALDREGPSVVLVVGVNGTGKTTTIGKMALELTRRGKRVMLVAADTFRAAAVDQLRIWAERTGSGFVSGDEGADPASVCYEAMAACKDQPPDVIFIDTAGRLHTKTYLMEELGKIIRVIKKIDPEAPHETILVLDATTGQNALNQVATFKEVSQVTGLVMTKLDGTAKGGILIAIKEAHASLPVFKIGVGEAAEDLRDFNAEEFADALFADGNHR